VLQSSLLAAQLLLIDPRAQNVDFSGGAAVEVRGGIAPPLPGEPSEPTLRLSLSPRAVMTYGSRARSRLFVLEYTPRVFVRLADSPLVSPRPLLFNQLQARYAADLGPRLSWSGSLGASIGQQDYASQSSGLIQGDGSQVDGGVDGAGSDVQTPQPALLDSPVIVTGGVAGGLGLVARLAPLHTLTVGPTVSVQRLLSSSGMIQGATFDQTSVDMTATYAWRPSRVDTVSAVASGGYVDFGTNGAQGFALGSLSWRRRLRPRLDGELVGGAFYTQQVVTPSSTATPIASAVPLMPVGNAILVGRVFERAHVRVVTDVNVGSQAYFDPVRGSVLPLSGGGVGTTVELPPDWTLGVTASFYTPPTRPSELEQRLAGDPASARTALSVRTPVTYAIDRTMSLEFGTITTARGPSVATQIPDPTQVYSNVIDAMDMDTGQMHSIETVPFDEIQFQPWRFTQTEFWVYVAFQFDYSTARSP